MAPDGEVLFVNSALVAMTGLAAEDLIGEHVSRLMPTPARRRIEVVSWLKRWADDPDPDQLRYLNLELVTRDGENRLVNVRASRHQDDGRTTFVVLLRDVTAEHHTVTELRHAQLVTNRILAIGEDAVICLDGHHQISYWNAAAAKLFGYARDEAIGQTLALILPSDTHDRHEKMITAFEDSADASRLMGERTEVWGRTKDGRILPLEVAITKTTVEGEVILSAQIRDISRRKHTEAALAASEARFRAVFEHAFEAMVLLDSTGQVIEINDSAQRLLSAYTPGRLFWELNWWGDADDGGGRDALRSAVTDCRNGRVIRSRISLPATGHSSREIDFSMLPIHDGDGELTWIIAEGRDITPVT